MPSIPTVLLSSWTPLVLLAIAAVSLALVYTRGAEIAHAAHLRDTLLTAVFSLGTGQVFILIANRTAPAHSESFAAFAGFILAACLLLGALALWCAAVIWLYGIIARRFRA